MVWRGEFGELNGMIILELPIFGGWEKNIPLKWWWKMVVYHGRIREKKARTKQTQVIVWEMDDACDGGDLSSWMIQKHRCEKTTMTTTTLPEISWKWRRFWKELFCSFKLLLRNKVLMKPATLAVKNSGL